MVDNGWPWGGNLPKNRTITVHLRRWRSRQKKKIGICGGTFKQHHFKRGLEVWLIKSQRNEDEKKRESLRSLGPDSLNYPVPQLLTYLRIYLTFPASQLIEPIECPLLLCNHSCRKLHPKIQSQGPVWGQKGRMNRWNDCRANTCANGPMIRFQPKYSSHGLVILLSLAAAAGMLLDTHLRSTCISDLSIHSSAWRQWMSGWSVVRLTMMSW